jgi:predicted acylesterase/phospholipase RssA
LRKKYRAIIAALVCTSALLALSGCVLLGDKLDQFSWHFTTFPFFVFDNAKGYVEPPQPHVLEHNTNIALAISGGGTRSAVFAAGIMEQLAHLENPARPGTSVMEDVDAISAVSGGSLAAAYYTLYKPANLRNPEETSAFFQRFKSHMTVDIADRSWVHYLSHPWEATMKYYTRYRFVQTLANTMDQYLYRGANFGHINEREMCGESPALIIQAASLDNGKKFLFTNLNVQNNFTVDPRAIHGSPPLEMLSQVAASPIYGAFGFDSINSDISSFRLASAVAASSAYPILPGQSALINYCTNGYVHLADGGVNDNFGIDSLIQLQLNRTARSGHPRHLVILSIDATSLLEDRHSGDPNGYISTIAYGEQATTILGTRGQTFASVLYNAQDLIRVVSLPLREADGFSSLHSKVSTYSISESEMHTVLDCAISIATRKALEISNAISGAPAAH